MQLSGNAPLGSPVLKKKKKSLEILLAVTIIISLHIRVLFLPWFLSFLLTSLPLLPMPFSNTYKEQL